MRQIIMCAVVTVCSLFLLAGSALAQDSYVVGVEDITYMPHYNWNGQEYGGFARLLLDSFAKDKGHTFSYEPLPIKRLFNAFLSQKSVDFKYPDNPIWSANMREGVDVAYSDPVVEYIDGVFVLPENKGNVDNLKTLGTVLGFTAWDYKGDIDSGKITVSENSNLESLLKMAIAGRVDAAYCNIAVGRQKLQEMGQEGKLVFDPALPHTRANYLVSSVKHPEVIKEFNEWMAANAGTIDAMKKKWGVSLAQ